MTRELIDGLVADACARGHDIAVLRRPDRRAALRPATWRMGCRKAKADCGLHRHL